MPQPKVSIIIPVYNVEAYLVRCLDSVCRQTEQDIEIIVVDDASSDNSWTIMEDYATRDSRIQAIRHLENKKQGAARNTGIEVAQGEWLLFLDSDDYLRLDTVEIFLNASKEYSELELIIFGTWQVLPNGEIMPFGDMPSSPILLSDTFREYCTQSNIKILHCAWGKLWHHSLFENMRFPENMSMEDLALVPRLFANLKDGKSLILAEELYFYQCREGSLDSHYTKQTGEYFGRAFHLLQEFTLQLSPERRPLLKDKMLQEFHGILQRKQAQNTEFQNALVEYIPKDLLTKGLWALSDKLCETQQNRWYRFGRLSRSRKFWTISKVLSKKLKLYSLLRPLAKLAKGILEKKR